VYLFELNKSLTLSYLNAIFTYSEDQHAFNNEDIENKASDNVNKASGYVNKASGNVNSYVVRVR